MMVSTCLASLFAPFLLGMFADASTSGFRGKVGYVSPKSTSSLRRSSFDDDYAALMSDVVNEKNTAEDLDHFQSHPLLQVPCALCLHGHEDRAQAVNLFCDTGATRTIMSWECAAAHGLLHHLDRRYAGKATGVGSCRVLGRIPAGICRLDLYDTVSVPSPAITIIESTGTPGVDFLLGLDFMREYDAVLDLRREHLSIKVGSEEHQIPFIRPRESLAPSFQDQGDNDDDCWPDEDESDDEERIDMSGI